MQVEAPLVDVIDEGVVERQLGTPAGEVGHHVDGGRLPHVADVGLVGDAEHEQLSPPDGAPGVVEGVDDALGHVGRHLVVDVLGELDDAERPTRVAP